MASCVAYGCTNRKALKNEKQLLSEQEKKLTFHKFPKHEGRRQLWISAVRRKNWGPSAHSYLCSYHFAEEYIDRTSLSCVRLRDHAVPTIFTEFPSYLQQEPKRQRKVPLMRMTETGSSSSQHIDELTLSNRCSRCTSVSPDRLMKSPLKKHLQSKLCETKEKYGTKIKTLQQKNRRLCKKNADFNTVIETLKNKRLVSLEELDTLIGLGEK